MDKKSRSVLIFYGYETASKDCGDGRFIADIVGRFDADGVVRLEAEIASRLGFQRVYIKSFQFLEES